MASMLRLLALVALASVPTATGFPVVRGDWFGESPPGAVPRLFAPGIASTDLHDDGPPVFTPDGNEAFLRVVGTVEGRITGIILHSVREDDVWSPPRKAWFSNESSEVEGPVALGPDGCRLYVSTVRPGSGEGRSDRDIWYFERTDSGWGEARSLGANLVSGFNDNISSVAADGTLYFDREPAAGPWFSRSYYARPDGAGGFEDPIEIVAFREFPYSGRMAVAPDQTYLVLTATHPTRGLDLWVSFRRGDDSWGSPVNLAAANSDSSDKFPGLSPDGRFLFFASRRPPPVRVSPRLWSIGTLQPGPGPGGVDVYWVSTALIDSLRPGPDQKAR